MRTDFWQPKNKPTRVLIASILSVLVVIAIVMITNGGKAGVLLLFIGVSIITGIWKWLPTSEPERPQHPVENVKIIKGHPKKKILQIWIKFKNLLSGPYLLYKTLPVFSKRSVLLTIVASVLLIAFPIAYIFYSNEYETRYRSYRYTFFKDGMEFYPASVLIAIIIAIILIFVFVWLYNSKVQLTLGPKLQNSSFEKGEVVRLKSGGPLMTIGQIKMVTVNLNTNNYQYLCNWIDSGSSELRGGWFFEDQLEGKS